MFAHIPEAKQSDTETEAPIQIMGFEQPVESEPEVINFDVATRQPSRAIFLAECWVPFFGQDEAVGGVSASRGGLFIAGNEAFGGVLANGFQHGETRFGLSAIHALHEILIHQRS